MEASRFPSSLEEDPPKTNFVDKVYESDRKIYVSVIILRDKAGYIYQSIFLLARLRVGPLAGVVR